MGVVWILGAGPAGSSAALAALREGCAVPLIEKSKFPRHKVCGEFFSSEIESDLTQLGAWQNFLDAAPSRIRRMELNFARHKKKSCLTNPAWGLSRYAFDHLLLNRALAEGAELVRGNDSKEPRPKGAASADLGTQARHSESLIVAAGRHSAGSLLDRGRRLFGFKAHFTGPSDDAVELFFFGRCYVGINPVEHGRTNVCGLAPEDFLRRFNFDFDEIVRQSPALADRLRPLERTMDWLSTGPLNFRQNFSPADAYLAGDALSFVDPFTGTGLLAAVKTGSLAGIAAARATPMADYLAQCRASLRKPFEVAAIFRKALNGGWAETLAPLVPSRVLFALTRPR